MSAWENLSSGLLGGIIGGVLSFLVSLYTIWRTRVGDRNREEQRGAELEERRRVEIAARLATTIRAFEDEVRWAPFLMGRYSARIVELTMIFAASQGKRHPLVSNWLTHQVQVQQAAMTSWRRVWWIPFLGKRTLRNHVGRQLGSVAGAITGWAAGQLPDEAFANPQLSAIQVVNSVRRPGARR